MNVDANCPIQKASKPNRRLKFKTIENVPLHLIKNISKQNGTTFNTVIQALLSMTIAEYNIQKGDSQTESITFGSAFSLTPFAKSREEFKVQNQATLQIYNLKLVRDFKEAVEMTKKLKEQNVSYAGTLANAWLMKLIFTLPYNIPYVNGTAMTQPMRFGYTNVPGPANGF